jgi:cytochrome d ubiquinol oxidase subunit II
VAGFVWWGVLALVALLTLASFSVQPRLQSSFAARPWGWVFPLIAVVALLAVAVMNRRSQERAAFLASSLFLAAMLVSVTFGLYPCVLPSNGDPARSLTIANASAAPYGLRIGLAWFIPGMLLTTAYFIYAYRSFAGKVRLEDQP